MVANVRHLQQLLPIDSNPWLVHVRGNTALQRVVFPILKSYGTRVYDPALFDVCAWYTSLCVEGPRRNDEWAQRSEWILLFTLRLLLWRRHINSAVGKDPRQWIQGIIRRRSVRLRQENRKSHSSPLDLKKFTHNAENERHHAELSDVGPRRSSSDAPTYGDCNGRQPTIPGLVIRRN